MTHFVITDVVLDADLGDLWNATRNVRLPHEAVGRHRPGTVADGQFAPDDPSLRRRRHQIGDVDRTAGKGTAMKTVPRNVHVVTKDQAVRVPDLPEEMSLALADIAAVAREGLLAMSVAAGMAVMQALFEAEIIAAAGVKVRHNPERTAVWHGTEMGSVTLGVVGSRSGGCGPRLWTVMRCRWGPTWSSPLMIF